MSPDRSVSASVVACRRQVEDWREPHKDRLLTQPPRMEATCIVFGTRMVRLCIEHSLSYARSCYDAGFIDRDRLASLPQNNNLAHSELKPPRALDATPHHSSISCSDIQLIMMALKAGHIRLYDMRRPVGVGLLLHFEG
ncbi:unnamed protein product [Peniophora sp. CBMAI 1063]|nr:unnamed protein product [Peniophora sp. CBMAI 1063]